MTHPGDGHTAQPVALAADSPASPRAAPARVQELRKPAHAAVEAPQGTDIARQALSYSPPPRSAFPPPVRGARSARARALHPLRPAEGPGRQAGQPHNRSQPQTRPSRGLVRHQRTPCTDHTSLSQRAPTIYWFYRIQSGAGWRKKPHLLCMSTRSFSSAPRSSDWPTALTASASPGGGCSSIGSLPSGRLSNSANAALWSGNSRLYSSSASSCNRTRLS